MKNRAKCALCLDIVESKYTHDFVSCRCGEISVDGGGSYFRCLAKDYRNFIRVDDEGNEIVMRPSDEIDEDGNEQTYMQQAPRLTREDHLKQLDRMIENIAGLPSAALSMPVTNYELGSILSLLSALFKASGSGTA